MLPHTTLLRTELRHVNPRAGALITGEATLWLLVWQGSNDLWMRDWESNPDLELMRLISYRYSIPLGVP